MDPWEDYCGTSEYRVVQHEAIPYQSLNSDRFFYLVFGVVTEEPKVIASDLRHRQDTLLEDGFSFFCGSFGHSENAAEKRLISVKQSRWQRHRRENHSRCINKFIIRSPLLRCGKAIFRAGR